MAHRLILAFLVTLLLAPPPAADELTPAKSADIKRLMEVTGSVNIAQQFASATSQQMFDMLKAARPDIPERALGVDERRADGVVLGEAGRVRGTSRR